MKLTWSVPKASSINSGKDSLETLPAERPHTEEIDQSPYPVIVCGDLNDVPNSYAYNHIGRGLRNAFVEKRSRNRPNILQHQSDFTYR